MDVSEVRALDVKIARMLGFDAHVSEDIVCVGRMDYQYEYMLVDKGHYKDYVPVPEYHTDTNAAIEMMNTIGKHYTIQCWQDKPMPVRFEVKIRGMRYAYPADTVAEACCKAFMAWHNTEVNTVTFETLADAHSV